MLCDRRSFVRLAGAGLGSTAFSAGAGWPVALGYLADLRRLQTQLDSLPAQEGPVPSAQRSSLLQQLGLFRSYLSQHERAIADVDLARPSPRAPPPLGTSLESAIAQAEVEDALPAIVAAAQDRQIVILNEAHHVPLHRAFAMRLAQRLRRLGFGTLACEAFAVGTPTLTSPTEIRPEHGFYLRDPVFAQLVTQALQSGWSLVSYESALVDRTLPMLLQIRQREAAQAANIVERVLARTPKAKLFIYVGYSHAWKHPVKGPDNEPLAWMAAVLKDLTGIDPLCIDQTTLFAHPDRAFEHPAYRIALARGTGRERAFMLRHTGDPLRIGVLPEAIDLQVIHPPQTLIHGRSAWLMDLAQRLPVAVPSELLPKRGERLLYAFHKGHSDQATPADMVLVQAGAEPASFMLPAGEMRFAFED